MSDIRTVVFYTIEKTIKTYRQFAQRRLVEVGSAVTVDQWLLLSVIDDHPGILQSEIADRVFKDRASITRMVDLLVTGGVVDRTIPKDDRRTVRLKLTTKGARHLATLTPVVQDYRKQALKGVTAAELAALSATLNKIMANCDE